MVYLFVNTSKNTLLIKNNHVISIYCNIYHLIFTYTSRTIVNIIDRAVVTWCDRLIILQKKPSKSQSKIVSAIFCHDNIIFNGSPTHGSFTHIKALCFVPLLLKKFTSLIPNIRIVTITKTVILLQKMR